MELQVRVLPGSPVPHLFGVITLNASFDGVQKTQLNQIYRVDTKPSLFEKLGVRISVGAWRKMPGTTSGIFDSGVCSTNFTTAIVLLAYLVKIALYNKSFIQTSIIPSGVASRTAGALQV